MSRISFIDVNSVVRTVDVEAGVSAMEAALNNGIPGIDGDCGGVAACATCHVFVDDAWIDRTGAASDDELQMLELAEGCASNSRLACQLIMSPELDGLILRTPEGQF